MASQLKLGVTVQAETSLLGNSVVSTERKLVTANIVHANGSAVLAVKAYVTPTITADLEPTHWNTEKTAVVTSSQPGD